MIKINNDRRNFLVVSASAAFANLFLGVKSIFAKKSETNNLTNEVIIANPRLGINLATIKWAVSRGQKMTI